MQRLDGDAQLVPKLPPRLEQEQRLAFAVHLALPPVDRTDRGHDVGTGGKTLLDHFGTDADRLFLVCGRDVYQHRVRHTHSTPASFSMALNACVAFLKSSGPLNPEN